MNCGFKRNDWVPDPRNPKQKGDHPGSIIRKGGDKLKIFKDIERGKENPTLNTILKLARSLNVKPDEFFTHLEIEDPAKRKSIIIEILDEADADLN